MVLAPATATAAARSPCHRVVFVSSAAVMDGMVTGPSPGEAGVSVFSPGSAVPGGMAFCSPSFSPGSVVAGAVDWGDDGPASMANGAELYIAPVTDHGFWMLAASSVFLPAPSASRKAMPMDLAPSGIWPWSYVIINFMGRLNDIGVRRESTV